MTFENVISATIEITMYLPIVFFFTNIICNVFVTSPNKFMAGNHIPCNSLLPNSFVCLFPCHSPLMRKSQIILQGRKSPLDSGLESSWKYLLISVLVFHLSRATLGHKKSNRGQSGNSMVWYGFQLSTRMSHKSHEKVAFRAKAKLQFCAPFTTGQR